MKAATIERAIKLLESEVESNDSQIERLENAETLSEAGEARIELLAEQRNLIQEAIEALQAALSAASQYNVPDAVFTA